MAFASEERVHEDECWSDDDHVNEGIEHKHDEEYNPLIFIFVADGLEGLLDWLSHCHDL